MLRNLKRAAAHLAMVLAPVNELSDAEPAAPDAPAAPSSSKDKQAALPSSTQAQPADALSPKPKGQAKGKAKAKAKAKGKGKAKPQAKKTDDKSAVKAKPSLKRPAAAASDEEPPMKKPASCHEEEPPMKKPASSTSAASWCVNKYRYARDGVWGIKVQKVEVFRVGSWLKTNANSMCRCSLLCYP